jgi:mRNA interferase MazF
LNRGEIWWASLGIPEGSSPGFRRPVLVLQADYFNRSKIQTVICAVITSNVILADAPGNIFLSKEESGLPKDSVINISQIVTLNKDRLTDLVRKVRPVIMKDIESGLKLVLEVD